MYDEKLEPGWTYNKSCAAARNEKRICIPIEIIVNRDWTNWIKEKIIHHFNPDRRQPYYSQSVSRNNIVDINNLNGFI